MPFSPDDIFKLIQRDVFDVFSHSVDLFPHTSLKGSSSSSKVVDSSASTFGAEEDDGLVQLSLVDTETNVAYAHPERVGISDDTSNELQSYIEKLVSLPHARRKVPAFPVTLRVGDYFSDKDGEIQLCCGLLSVSAEGEVD